MNCTEEKICRASPNTLAHLQAWFPWAPPPLANLSPTLESADVFKVSSCSGYYEETVCSLLLETKGHEEFTVWKMGSFDFRHPCQNLSTTPVSHHVIPGFAKLWFEDGNENNPTQQWQTLYGEDWNIEMVFTIYESQTQVTPVSVQNCRPDNK